MRDFESQYWEEINKLKARITALENKGKRSGPTRSPYDLNAMADKKVKR